VPDVHLIASSLSSVALLAVNVEADASGHVLTMVEKLCRKELAQYPDYEVLVGLRTVKSCAGMKSYSKHTASCPVSIEQGFPIALSRAGAGLVVQVITRY
jgi:hypothetical protein